MKKKTTRQLEWSKRSIADRKKIARFYSEEASLFIAQEADHEIIEAARRILRRPLSYREGKRSGTREYVMRRFPYILVYRVQATKVSILRCLHQALRYFN
ncbi:type II toxin-antitoxin system RelE/ParE family toxin [Propionivibrio sp.]|uniref:type II toxin-antitoxin system RelE/ParE family toxin n=1 Tax=Propionivibrio sp. TaxID=2212460 RepID=UPI003BF432B7